MAFWNKDKDDKLKFDIIQGELSKVKNEIEHIKKNFVLIDSEFRHDTSSKINSLIKEVESLKKEILELTNSVKNIWGTK